MKTRTEIKAAFDAEMGEASGLFSTEDVASWFNDGQARLEYLVGVKTPLIWFQHDKEIQLPQNFAQIDRIVYHTAPEEGWLLQDKKLIHPDGFGASDGSGYDTQKNAAGGSLMDSPCDLEYWAYPPDVGAGTNLVQDVNFADIANKWKAWPAPTATRALYTLDPTYPNALKITRNLAGSQAGVYQDYIPVKAGEFCEYEFALKLLTPGGGEIRGVSFFADFWTDNREYIHGYWRYFYGIRDIEWQIIKGVFNPPPETDHVDFFIYLEGSSHFNPNLATDELLFANPQYYVGRKTQLPRGGDAACTYYALSRAYRKLSSNRTLYKRYSTLLGSNAVSMEDLRRMSDELYEDFVEAKEDLPTYRG